MNTRSFLASLCSVIPYLLIGCAGQTGENDETGARDGDASDDAAARPGADGGSDDGAPPGSPDAATRGDGGLTSRESGANVADGSANDAARDPDGGEGDFVDSTGTAWGRGTPEPGVTALTKMDLLFVIDNSVSMADKQEILRAAVPDLVTQLATESAYKSLEDLHVGVISSSLGGLGAEGVCDLREEENDRAHLVGTRARAADLGLATGFVEWTPNSDGQLFAQRLEQLIERTGETGCGFESTLEAWYRFLVDPAPYADIAVVPCPNAPNNPCSERQGLDEALLAQREAFLRPDSLLSVVVVSDEDDCSMKTGGQWFYAGRKDILLPRASSECAQDPNDPCCHSCGVAPPAGCQGGDTECTLGQYTQTEDPVNLRCFDQKRRFGLEFLYPVERYAAALSSAEIRNHAGDFVPNPLFSGPEGATRDPSMVVLTTLVGVPWQDIQAKNDAAGNPLPENTLRFKLAAEMEETWPLIVGDPSKNVPPTDPLMVQSVQPRSGTSPLVGALAPPSAGYLDNAANGHEHANLRGDDLQYACIFPLSEQRDCVTLTMEDPLKGCDCRADGDPVDQAQNPLCQNTTGEYSSIQRFGKAYPGTRHLLTAQAVGSNGVVASICPRNVDDPSRPDYGYRPTLGSLLEHFEQLLR